MSMIDTDMVRSALRSAASAAGEAETFFDILIPVDDGRKEGPLMIGQLFGVDLLQHPDVPAGEMHIKRKPLENYQPQAMIADLQESRALMAELMNRMDDGTSQKEHLTITISVLDDKIMEYQQMIVKGPKS